MHHWIITLQYADLSGRPIARTLNGTGDFQSRSQAFVQIQKFAQARGVPEDARVTFFSVMPDAL